MTQDMSLELKIQALVKGIDQVKLLAKEVQGLGKVADEVDRTETAVYRLGQTFRSALGGVTAAGGVAAAVFAAMANRVVDADAKINALSQRTGIAADKLGELKYAAEQSNTSIDAVAAGVSYFNRVLFDAQKGGASAKLFTALGLDPKSIGDTDQALETLIGKISTIGDESTRSAVIQKFFGRGAAELKEFFSLGAEGISKLREEARALGTTTIASAKAADDFQDSIGKLTTATQALVRDGLNPMLPAISRAIQALVDGRRETGSWLQSMRGWFNASSAEFDNLPKAIDATTDRIAELKKKLEESKKPTLGNLANEAIFSTTSGISGAIRTEEKRLAYLRARRANELDRMDAEARSNAAGTSRGVDLSAFGKDPKAAAKADYSAQRFALAKADAEAELKILQDTLQRYSKEWDYALDKNLVSFRAAAQARINIAQAEIDAQIKARQEELDAAEKIANDPKAGEGKKLDALAKVKGLVADITVLQRQRADVEVTEGRKATDQEEAIANRLREVRAELAALTGQGGSGGSIRAQLEQSLKQLLESPSVSDADKGMLSRFIGVKEAEGKLKDFQAEYSRALEQLSVAQDAIEIQQKAGTLTETQARQQLVDLYRQTGTELDALLPKLEALAATGELPEAQLAMERLKNKVTELKVATDDLATQFRGTLGDAVGNFLTDFETGAKSLGQSLTDAVKGFERSILDVINKRLGTALVDSLLGPMKGAGGSGGGGGMLSSAFDWFTKLFNFKHGGGLVGGPSRTLRAVNPLVFAGAPRMHGGGIAGDEVPTILQKGEVVFSRGQVAAGMAGGAAPIVNIINPPSQPTVSARRNGNAFELDVVFRQVEGYLTDRAMKGQGLGKVFDRSGGGVTR